MIFIQEILDILGKIDIDKAIKRYNGGIEKSRNERAKVFAHHYNKPITSDLDFHEV